MAITNKFLFNFAASYSGGGLKRLHEYARRFNGAGGAYFIIHRHCEWLKETFPNNWYYVSKLPKIQRIFNDCKYLNAVKKEIGVPDLYYSYGIPLYFRLGIINWFHLSNVLPLGTRGIPLPLYDRFSLGFLGWQIKRNFHNADVISAESIFSLGLIGSEQDAKKVLSVNGSDDELAYLGTRYVQSKDNIAVVLGTHKYKALEDSWRVFKMLRTKHQHLKLVIVGNEKYIPSRLKQDKSVIIAGLVPRSEVMIYLQKAAYYISTTYIENSYNAAAEGIFCADESFVSDIGPHRELLKDIPFRQIAIPEMSRPMLNVRRESVSGTNLRTWESVITDMIVRFRNELRRRPAKAG